MIDPWQRATLPRIIASVFHAARLVLYQQDGETILRMEESQAKRV
jgi:hypothetical protein